MLDSYIFRQFSVTSLDRCRQNAFYVRVRTTDVLGHNNTSADELVNQIFQLKCLSDSSSLACCRITV